MKKYIVKKLTTNFSQFNFIVKLISKRTMTISSLEITYPHNQTILSRKIYHFIPVRKIIINSTLGIRFDAQSGSIDNSMS